MYFSQTSVFFFILTGDLVVSLAAVFWMSRKAPPRSVAWHPKNGCEGDLGFGCCLYFRARAERWLKNPLESPFETRVPGSDKTVLQSSASSSKLRSREIFLYAVTVACRLIGVRVLIVRIALVLPGAVDCSLAVTNNSPVWRPQGTHGEAYLCITWCSWLFISSN